MSVLLEVSRLRVDLGTVSAVRDASLSIAAGQCLALVGESGCGKSVTAGALLGLLPAQARVAAQHWQFAGEDLRGIGERQWRRLRGRGIGMIFQNPMVALNPTMRIGEQIAEPLRLHRGLKPAPARREAIALLERLSIRDAARRARQYPFEFSGGMLQRVMIAAALASGPRLLIADEPTTALDVTVQAEVLALLDELRRERGMALLLITHDLGVVARMADEVAVMYAGEVVEYGPVDHVFYDTAHPYTRALQASMPGQGGPGQASGGRLPCIEGYPPDLRRSIEGCAFTPRCPLAMNICGEPPPDYHIASDHRSRCWRWHPEHPRRGLND